MRPLITFSFLFLASFGYAQTQGTSYSLEISLNRSARLDDTGHYIEPALGGNAYATIAFKSKRSWQYTVGLGYLHSHVINRSYTGMQPYSDDEQHFHFNYLGIPAGIKFNIGSFYIHPEAVASYNFKTCIKSYIVDADQDKIEGPFTYTLTSGPFEVFFATLLTVGYEFEIGSTTLLTGVKGFIDFNHEIFSTYGIGVMVGVKI